jgi:hypothetical protein
MAIQDELEKLKQRIATEGITQGGQTVLAAGRYDPTTNVVRPQDTIASQTLTGITPEEKQAMDITEQELLRGGYYTKDALGNFIRGTEPTEESARARATALFQGQIDALESEKAAARTRLAEYYKPIHQRRLGAQRALMASAGMLGQVSGQSQKSVLESANASELLSAQAQSDAQYNMKIAELQTSIRTEASKFYDEQRKAYEGKAKDLIDFLNNKNILKNTGVSNVIKQALSLGIDLEKDTSALDQAVVGLKDMRVSREQILSAYKTAKAEKAAADAKAAAEVLKSKADLDKVLAETKRIQAETGKTWAEAEKIAIEKLAKEKEAGLGKYASTPKGSSDQVQFLMDTAQKAMDLSGASGKGIWDRASGWIFGSSTYNRLEQMTNTLRTNMLTLATDPNIKKFFGPQMSDADVRLMTSAGTTLNPEFNNPEELRAELQRINSLLARMKSAVDTGIVNESSKPNQMQLPDGTIVYLQSDGTYK